jgi:hypothetical protein
MRYHRKMIVMALALAFVLDVAPSQQVDVTATWVAPSGSKTGSIAVTFEPRDPDVHVNRDPAPRLRIDPAQKVLKTDDKALTAVTHAPAGASGDALKYLRASEPVQFPAALAATAPKGPQTVRTSLTYYYCSATEGWCRKGTADLDVAVDVK